MKITVYNLNDSPLTSPYAQIYEHQSGLIFDEENKAEIPLILAANLDSYTDSVIPLTKVDNLNAWVADLPIAFLPNGDYHLIIKDAVAPGDTDRVVDFGKFTIAGGKLSSSPSLLGRII